MSNSTHAMTGLLTGAVPDGEEEGGGNGGPPPGIGPTPVYGCSQDFNSAADGGSLPWRGWTDVDLATNYPAALVVYDSRRALKLTNEIETAPGRWGSFVYLPNGCRSMRDFVQTLVLQEAAVYGFVVRYRAYNAGASGGRGFEVEVDGNAVTLSYWDGSSWVQLMTRTVAGLSGAWFTLALRVRGRRHAVKAYASGGAEHYMLDYMSDENVAGGSTDLIGVGTDQNDTGQHGWIDSHDRTALPAQSKLLSQIFDFEALDVDDEHDRFNLWAGLEANGPTVVAQGINGTRSLHWKISSGQAYTSVIWSSDVMPLTSFRMTLTLKGDLDGGFMFGLFDGAISSGYDVYVETDYSPPIFLRRYDAWGIIDTGSAQEAVDKTSWWKLVWECRDSGSSVEHKIKMFKVSTGDDETWAIEHTDNSPPATAWGNLGVAWIGNANNNQYVWLDDFMLEAL